MSTGTHRGRHCAAVRHRELEPLRWLAWVLARPFAPLLERKTYSRATRPPAEEAPRWPTEADAHTEVFENPLQGKEFVR